MVGVTVVATVNYGYKAKYQQATFFSLTKLSWKFITTFSTKKLTNEYKNIASYKEHKTHKYNFRQKSRDHVQLAQRKWFVVHNVNYEILLLNPVQRQ